MGAGRGAAGRTLAPHIVAALWGVDVDPRCAQVASAAIVLRARRHCRDVALPVPNIVTARGIPGGAALPEDLELDAQEREVVDRIGTLLADAPLLGVLLKAEEALEQAVRHAAFGGAAGTLPLATASFEQAEADLTAHLQAIADRAASSVAERLLAAEAGDALRFLDIVRRRYDVVVMNPPFGEPLPSTKPYLRAAYPWLPTKARTCWRRSSVGGLSSASRTATSAPISRARACSSRPSSAPRREVVLGNRLQTVVDLGLGVMEQALVEAAAYTLGPGRPSADHEATFVRLLKDADREAGLLAAVGAIAPARQMSGSIACVCPTSTRSRARHWPIG